MWKFWLNWTLLNAFGWLLALLLPDLGIPGARLVAFGFIVGIAQAYAMDLRVDDFAWFISNMIGWTLGFLVAELLLLAYAPDLFAQLAGTFNIFGFILGSICSVLFQYLAHWRNVFGGWRTVFVFAYLIPVAALAGFVGGVVYLRLTLYLPTVIDPLQNTLAVIAGFVLTGAAYGLVSGLPIFTLLRVAPPSPYLAEKA